MLAILLIEMTWYKRDKTPERAVLRQRYYRPVRIENGVELQGTGVFYKQCFYRQDGDRIVSGEEVFWQWEQSRRADNKGSPFMGRDEREERRAGSGQKAIRKERGAFLNMEKLKIPCVSVSEEAEEGYRIRWYDYGCGMPRRRGGNEEFCNKGSELAGKPNTLNETAFILREGEAGMLRYNYRYTSFEDQWYRCYHVYAVNAIHLTQDVFLRNYDYEYNQMAHLF